MISHGRLRAGAVERGLVRRAPLVVAADGGAAAAIRLGRVPDVVVGDLDSLPAGVRRRLARRRVEIVRHEARKDETDTELAVAEAIRRGHRDVVVLGALGGRLDHALANVGLLSRAAGWGARLRLVDGATTAEVVERELRLDARAGDVVSLIPLEPAVEGIRSEGLEYPLRGETLALGSTRGVSNVVTDDTASVRVASGRLLAVRIRSRRPPTGRGRRWTTP